MGSDKNQYVGNTKWKTKYYWRFEMVWTKGVIKEDNIVKKKDISIKCRKKKKNGDIKLGRDHKIGKGSEGVKEIDRQEKSKSYILARVWSSGKE